MLIFGIIKCLLNMESNIQNIIKTKLNELEEKNKLYKLKRYEKKLMKKYRNILLLNDKKELIIEKLKESEKNFEKKNKRRK
jgi:DNA relaxase NicK